MQFACWSYGRTYMAISTELRAAVIGRDHRAAATGEVLPPPGISSAAPKSSKVSPFISEIISTEAANGKSFASRRIPG
jgi:hypothetical protein